MFLCVYIFILHFLKVSLKKKVFGLSNNTASCDIKFIQYNNYKKGTVLLFPVHAGTFHMACEWDCHSESRANWCEGV